MRPIFIIHNNTHCDEILADKISTHMGFEIREINVENLDYISKLVEDEDAALLIIGINTNKEIQFYLDKCRDLRIPYIFVKNNITADFKIDTILLPITNLEEEKEKGPFASSFARHFNSEIKIYQPNDYGSKATKNIEAIKNLFDSFNLTYTTIKGKKDSHKIELEAGKLNHDASNSILIISASRDYGLDDLIFGPKERKILKNVNHPTMLINPRGDLYALCD